MQWNWGYNRGLKHLRREESEDEIMTYASQTDWRVTRVKLCFRREKKNLKREVILKRRQSLQMALLKEIRELIVRRYAEDLFDEEKKTSYGKKTYRSYGRKRAWAVVINI